MVNSLFVLKETLQSQQIVNSSCVCIVLFGLMMYRAVSQVSNTQIKQALNNKDPVCTMFDIQLLKGTLFTPCS